MKVRNQINCSQWLKSTSVYFCGWIFLVQYTVNVFHVFKYNSTLKVFLKCLTQASLLQNTQSWLSDALQWLFDFIERELLMRNTTTIYTLYTKYTVTVSNCLKPNQGITSWSYNTEIVSSDSLLTDMFVFIKMSTVTTLTI